MVGVGLVELDMLLVFVLFVFPIRFPSYLHKIEDFYLWKQRSNSSSQTLQFEVTTFIRFLDCVLHGRSREYVECVCSTLVKYAIRRARNLPQVGCQTSPSQGGSHRPKKLENPQK